MNTSRLQNIKEKVVMLKQKSLGKYSRCTNLGRKSRKYWGVFEVHSPENNDMLGKKDWSQQEKICQFQIGWDQEESALLN